MKILTRAPLAVIALVAALLVSSSLLAQNTLLELQAEYRSLYQSTHQSVLMVSASEIDPDAATGGTMSLQTSATSEVGFVVEGGYVICDAEEVMYQVLRSARADPREALEEVTTMHARTADGQAFTMDVVGTDIKNLLMVCRLPENIDLPQLKLGNSDETEFGETVAALGNGFDVMLVDRQVGFYMGTLSEITRFEPHDYYDPSELGDPYKGSTLCFEGAVNPGDYGGPLINMRGEVIGMLSSHFHAGRRTGSAVPSSQFRHAFDAIVAGEQAPRSKLGFKVKNSDTINDRDPAITGVRDAGPAADAGFELGDRVIMIDGFPVRTQGDIRRILGFRYDRNDEGRVTTYGLPPGCVILFTMKRDDELVTLEMTAGSNQND